MQGHRIGYVRVSSFDQNPERQLEQTQVSKVFTDKASGRGPVFTGEDSPMANLMLSVMGAFAEFERALIRERQREGITLAKQRGAYRGRKKALSDEQAATLWMRAAAGEPKAQLARAFNISRQTLYQYLRTNE
ncbi:recombinase family protein [Pseudomonas aeruginosa]|nr:recombinase family protein [Pseudomonas aeruginosa]KSN66224.1 hypothetical protein APA80_12005 [Pseudomonas aeruginosa]